MSAREDITTIAVSHGWQSQPQDSATAHPDRVVLHSDRVVLLREGVRVVVAFTPTGRVHCADRFQHGNVVTGFVAPREHSKSLTVINWLIEGC